MVNHTLLFQLLMPKKQQGQVVHGGKDYERAARKEEARKKKEAEQNAKHELYLKGRAMVTYYSHYVQIMKI